MRNAGLDEVQAGIKIARRNLNNLRYTDDGRRQWHPTPVFLPGKSHGRRSLVGYSPWGCKELDMTEQLMTMTIRVVKHASWQKVTASHKYQISYLNEFSAFLCMGNAKCHFSGVFEILP